MPETSRARMLKLKTQLNIVKYSLYVKKIPLGGVQGRRAPWCEFGTPNIWENTRARKLKLKTPLDIVKYSHRVQEIFF